MRMHGKGALVGLLIGIASSALSYVHLASATTYCENIDSERVIVGEVRYVTDADDDECYANSYWDLGDELSLAGTIGGARP